MRSLIPLGVLLGVVGVLLGVGATPFFFLLAVLEGGEGAGTFLDLPLVDLRVTKSEMFIIIRTRPKRSNVMIKNIAWCEKECKSIANPCCTGTGFSLGDFLLLSSIECSLGDLLLFSFLVGVV